MNDDQIWTLIETSIMELHDLQDALIESLRPLNVNPESILYNAFYEAQANAIIWMSLYVDDTFEFIGWYCCECEYGCKPMKAGPIGKEREIESIDDLRWLIENTQ